MSATCPSCLRRLATPADADATLDHALRCECAICGGVCYAWAGLTVPCDERRAARLAKEPVDVLARLAAHINPATLREVADLLEAGATPDHAGQGVGDHVDHLRGHLGAVGDYTERDPDSGRLQLVHVAARALLAADAAGGWRR